jgi:hypothetical protein
MDELAMFGELVITGGGSATTITTDQLAQDQGHPPPEFSAEERVASDVVFTAPPGKHPPSLAVTAFVVTAGALALKTTVIDEARSIHDDEEDEPPKDEPKKDQA